MIFTARLLRRCPMPLPDLLLLSELGWHPLALDTRVKHSRIMDYNRARTITWTALPKQTRNATNRLRFVHFQINRRRWYVNFPVGFLYEENDFTQYLKIYLDHSDLKIFRFEKNRSFRINILWVLGTLPPRRTRERQDNLKNVIYR